LPQQFDAEIAISAILLLAFDYSCSASGANAEEFMNRTVLLVVLLLVVIVGGGLAFIFLNNNTPPAAEVTGDANTEIPRGVQETREPTPTDIPMVPVVIAIQDIPRGTVIGPDRVEVINFPAANAPSGAFVSEEDVVGYIAATDIIAEEIILVRKLVEDLNAIGDAGSDAAAILDPQRVAIAVPIDEITSVAYGLQPGDRIDVIVSMLFVDVDEDFQTLLPNDMRILSSTTDENGLGIDWGSASFGSIDTTSLFIPLVSIDPTTEAIIGLSGQSASFTIVEEPNPLDGRRQRPRLVTQRTITDAQVIWVGEFPQDGRIFAPAPTPTEVATSTPEGGTSGEEGTAPANTPVPPRPSLMTLAVNVQDAVVLSWLSEAGLPMTFVMRSARSQGLPDTQPVTMNYIMQQYNIAVPDRYSYALEPAIRGIRGVTLLDIGDERSGVVVEPTAAGDEEDEGSSGG
jgi:Flp pilus assembly protein CpaB